MDMKNFLAGAHRAFKARMMIKMLFALAIVVSFATFVCAPPAMNGQNRAASPKNEATTAGGDVARGKYLVEGVAMCGQCHTPRDSNGVLDRSRWLQGASVPFMPAQARQDWPLLAPRIGGTPPASDADMIKLLTTGIWTNGQPLRFPMMPFRMSEADAKAVVAYLKTAGPRN
jgi:mono/diheme cytochrome c family protein